MRKRELTRGELFGSSYRRVGRDTYVVAGAPSTVIGRIDAALTAAGPSAVATGWSACAVLGLDVANGPKPVEVTVGDRQPRARPGLLVRYASIPAADVTVEDGRRVTTALRTAYDLASRSCREPAGDPGFDPFADALVAADALGRLGRFDGARLAAFAREHPGARGVRTVARVAALMDPSSDSPPETRLRLRLTAAGLPAPVLQHRVPDEHGRRVWLLDLAWPRFGVAVEYDGRDHAQADRRARDIDRIDDLRRQGWIVIVVTSVQLARRRWVTDRVREALADRGWTGCA